MNLDRLASLHVAQLGLLEVRGNPDIFERHEGSHVLTDRDVVHNFYALGRDDAISRRHDLRVAQVELGLGQLRTGLLYLCRCLISLRLLDLDLIRAILGIA